MKSLLFQFGKGEIRLLPEPLGRFATEELLGGPRDESGVFMTPTYGKTLMGLACSKPVSREDKYKITYYAPQPRAVIEVVDFDNPTQLVGYGETGRVRLTQPSAGGFSRVGLPPDLAPGVYADHVAGEQGRWSGTFVHTR